MFPRKITAKWLEEQGACESGISEFTRLFPNGATITKANLEKASDEGLRLYWMAECLPRRSRDAMYRRINAALDRNIGDADGYRRERSNLISAALLRYAKTSEAKRREKNELQKSVRDSRGDVGAKRRSTASRGKAATTTQRFPGSAARKTRAVRTASAK